MILNNKKRLIAAGCSFTASDFFSVLEPEIDCSFPKWPEVFNSLCNDEFKVENLGVCGLGNDYIFKSAIHSILKNPKSVGLVVIAMTEISRYSFGKFNVIYSTRFYEMVKDVESVEDFIKVKKTDQWHEHVTNVFSISNTPSNLKTIIDAKLIEIYTFQALCEKFNIPYIIVPMLPQFDIGLREHVCFLVDVENYWTEQNIARCMFKSVVYDYIDDSKIMLWPFLPSLGGNDIHSLLTPEERVGKIDMHPNELGHENIAKRIYEFYKEVYK